MNKGYICALMSAAAVLAACSREDLDSPARAADDTEDIEASLNATARPGVSVVELDDSMLALVESGDTEALAYYGILGAEPVFEIGGESEPLQRRAGLHRFYRVTFSKVMPVTKAVEGFAQLPGVISADPVRPVRKRAVFNDPNLSRQWHYTSATPGASVNVESIWQNYTTGSSDVIVAVVDEGVCYSHPDLQANMWTDGSGHYGRNFSHKSYSYTISWTGKEDTGHGTHCAGTIAAVNNNGIGVCGIAGGDYAKGIKGVRIMSCQIFDNEDIADDDACADAIRWARDNGAVVCSNSWGYSADQDDDGRVSTYELNYFKSISCPASLKSAIKYFTDYAGCDPATGLQKSGAPVKGGLVFFAAGNENIDYDPICSYDQVIAVAATNNSGTKASYSNYGSWVDVSAPGGDTGNYIWSTLPTNITSSGYGGTGWCGTSMACPHASGVAALAISYFGGPGFLASDLREAMLTTGVSRGTSSRPIGRALDAVEIFKALDKSSAPQAPVIRIADEDYTFKAHVTGEIMVSVTDRNGDAFSVELTSPGSAAASLRKADDNTYYIDIEAPKASAGTYTAVVKATDVTGLFSEEEVSYTILENHAPVLGGTLDDFKLTALEQRTAKVFSPTIFSDPDGESLDLSVISSDEEIATVEVGANRSRVYVTAHMYGTCTVTVTATDALGLSVSTSFVLAVWDPDASVSLPDAPASDNITLQIGSESYQDVKVLIVSATGSKIYQTYKVINVFDPASIDTSALAPGIYTIYITYGGKTYKQIFVKK